MKTSSNGTALIREFEGFVANAYLCPAKVWTIGIGTTAYPNGAKVKICNAYVCSFWIVSNWYSLLLTSGKVGEN